MAPAVRGDTRRFESWPQPPAAGCTLKTVGDVSDYEIETVPMTVESIRERPVMFVGNPSEDGVLQLVLEVVANAYDQHLAGRCTAIGVELDSDGTITVTDDGPGIPLDAERPVDELLLTRSNLPTVDGHKPHMHLGNRGGLGLVVVNALSERFDLVTVCDGREARVSFARGEIIEPLAIVAGARRSGTVVRFRPDPELFVQPRVARAALAAVLEDLSFLSPGLSISFRVGGADVARDGLRGRVAIAVPCPTSEVAHLRERHETSKGPIDVEVAVGWRTSWFDAMEPPHVHSFVNFVRTPEHGVHVDGLIDGVCEFLGTDNREECVEGVVASVAVVLADVQYGNPTTDRLVTPEVRTPVATSTRKALEAWAATHSAERAALMSRASQLATVDRLLAALDRSLISQGFSRHERMFRRVTADGLVHTIAIGIHAHADRFVRERRYAAFHIWLGVIVPEVSKYHEEMKANQDGGCCFSMSLETIDNPPSTTWPSDGVVDVIPDVLARLERDGLPLLAGLSTRAEILAQCRERADDDWWLPLRPRVIAAIILAEQGATDEAKQLLAAQIAGDVGEGHRQYVRSIASRLKIVL